MNRKAIIMYPKGMTMAIQRNGKTAIFSSAAKAFKRNDIETQAKAVQKVVLIKAVTTWMRFISPAGNFQFNVSERCLFSFAVMAAPIKASIKTKWWVNTVELATPVWKTVRAITSKKGKSANRKMVKKATKFSNPLATFENFLLNIFLAILPQQLP